MDAIIDYGENWFVYLPQALQLLAHTTGSSGWVLHSPAATKHSQPVMLSLQPGFARQVTS